MKLKIPVREGLLYSEIATVKNKGDTFTPRVASLYLDSKT